MLKATRLSIHQEELQSRYINNMVGSTKRIYLITNDWLKMIMNYTEQIRITKDILVSAWKYW